MLSYFVGGHNIAIQHKLFNRHTVRGSCELQREHEILHQSTQKDNTKKTRQTNETKTYIGVTVNEFKTREYQNETELSKYLWKLKVSNRPHKIKWGIIKKIPPCKPCQRRCGLCFEEKLVILRGRTRKKFK